LLAGLHKNYSTDFHTCALWSWKKQLDFGGDQIMLHYG